MEVRLGRTREASAVNEALLARAGSGKARILRASFFFAGIADLVRMSHAWDARGAPGNAPACVAVEVRFAKPGWKVEIIAAAAARYSGRYRGAGTSLGAGSIAENGSVFFTVAIHPAHDGDSAVPVPARRCKPRCVCAIFGP